MSDDRGGWLDRAVELLARALDALGFNGSRVRWRWNRRRQEWGESGARASMMLRSARGRHKMCRSCRALVPRSSSRCPECGTDLGTVRGPGVGRLLGNIFPGTRSATALILLVNGLLFLMMLANSVQSGRASGLFRLDGITVLRYGSAHALLIAGDGEWWRLVTAVFLHGGLMHFVFNSFALLSLGPIVESVFGSERFWVIYAMAGVAGNALHAVIDPRHPVVGASGAICGLVGLLIAYGSRTGTVAGHGLKTVMLRYTLLIILISLIPGVSWQAHLGGFLAGLALGWIVPTGGFRSRATASLWSLLSLSSVVLVLFCFYHVARYGADALRHLGI